MDKKKYIAMVDWKHSKRFTRLMQLEALTILKRIEIDAAKSNVERLARSKSPGIEKDL